MQFFSTRWPADFVAIFSVWCLRSPINKQCLIFFGTARHGLLTDRFGGRKYVYIYTLAMLMCGLLFRTAVCPHCKGAIHICAILRKCMSGIRSFQQQGWGHLVFTACKVSSSRSTLHRSCIFVQYVHILWLPWPFYQVTRQGLALILSSPS